MFAKINHVAIVSRDYAQLVQFYEAVFGMRTSAKTRPGSAVTVGDGYVGLNINPRRAGRAAGLDHFGIEVEDAQTVFERMRKNYPSVKWLKRPSNRPFAGITTHDPDGNVFDISQKDMKNRTSVYVENDGKANPRHINHVAMRTMRPAEMADFFYDVFELAPGNKKPDDRNHYATDGRVTLVIMPWEITDYEGTGIITPGMDHIGFKVACKRSRRTWSGSPPTIRGSRRRRCRARREKHSSNCSAAPVRSAHIKWPTATVS
jgi:catechol 2,3-dioxygenase-like lactoylglutathione lyase family enzyme